MDRNGENPVVLKVCAWLGPAFVLFFVIGVAPLAGFFPPDPGPTDSAEEVRDFYLQNLDSIRAGCAVMTVATTFLLPFSMAIAAYTRHAENRRPVLFYIQVGSAAIGTLDIMLIPIFWGVGSYRAGDISAEVTQTWNDIAWFGVLFSWPPFSIWCLAIAGSILLDRREAPPFPRWVGYFNIWVALLYVPAVCMIFTKTGPLAWTGAIGFWIPTVTFFAWVVTMAIMVHRAVNVEQAAFLAGSPSRVPERPLESERETLNDPVAHQKGGV